MKEDKPVFNPSIPVVHSLSGYALVAKGWVRKNGEYTKGEMTLKYTGDKWILNGNKVVEFFEDLKPKQ